MGGLNFEFPGPLKSTPSYRDYKENHRFGGQKSKSFRVNFRGEIPRSSVRYVLSPLYPSLRALFVKHCRDLLTHPFVAAFGSCPIFVVGVGASVLDSGVLSCSCWW